MEKFFLNGYYAFHFCSEIGGELPVFALFLARLLHTHTHSLSLSLCVCVCVCVRERERERERERLPSAEHIQVKNMSM
jgi:hypothetical protein